jgi:hypothetical protein
VKKEKEIVPSGAFPDFPLHKLLCAKPGERWQVLCGDRKHWRVGFSSPAFTSPDEIDELEKHSCAEMFLLLKGRVVMILDDGHGEFELELKPMQPVMVSGWHRSYCPDGPHTGVAAIVERDGFTTVYKKRLGG